MFYTKTFLIKFNKIVLIGQYLVVIIFEILNATSYFLNDQERMHKKYVRVVFEKNVKFWYLDILCFSNISLNTSIVYSSCVRP